MLQSSHKDLHHSTPHDAIIEAIEATNNRVKGEIINARYGPDKKPTSTFLSTLSPVLIILRSKASNIYLTKGKDRRPQKIKTIVQCQRCQQYGHSKNNCMRPYRCVKCGEGHKSSECKRKIELHRLNVLSARVTIQQTIKAVKYTKRF
ncbi:Nucleic-acid-binding protein from transposon X-element [Eumeta japonica]|uniref:Nucleic-acid-binding protein from transposon X-element n=1 Tax=Eumeta variegata TaxID=151549 RepID=A0A4C1YEL7_EUMVA|nr:Nucleic-acid-binding protein from transposon X-element [Eumeta japonica]